MLDTYKYSAMEEKQHEERLLLLLLLSYNNNNNKYHFHIDKTDGYFCVSETEAGGMVKRRRGDSEGE